MQKILAVAIAFICLSTSFAQKPKTYTSSEIYEKVQKLNFLGTALYIAAHPDDENTALIAYLSNNVKARTGYLSLTRGDGGQNLIGTELRELLGVLRTQELLAARRIDGGEQFFTRANDFGFSKHPDETLEFWNKKEVLGDVVWTIRNFKPDIIINRFDHRTPGSTHGHHTTSAILSVEAFDKVNNNNEYKEQLAYVDTWQPKRMFFNTSWWFYGSQDKFEKADKSKFVSVDAGVYYPLKGKSNGEIAALSRSQHKCQGFGTAGTRGSKTEYLELLKGDLPKNPENLFDGINTTWSRVKGGKAIGDILYKVEENFDFQHPEKHIDDLLKAYTLIEKLDDAYWRNYKLEEISNIILACCGLYIQPNATNAYATPGSTANVVIELTNRSNVSVILNSISAVNTSFNKNYATPLLFNQENEFSLDIPVAANATYNTPYWLRNQGTLGMYNVNNQQLIGKPESPAAINTKINLTINGVAIAVEKPVFYKKVSPDKGEQYILFYILPKVTASVASDVIIFSTPEPKDIEVTVVAGEDNTNATVSLKVPNGWVVSPKSIPVVIARKDEAVNYKFKVTPPQSENVGVIQPVVTINAKQYSDKLVTIDYDHIPKQFILMPATSKVVRLNIDKGVNHIGYIAGAGDKIPESLREVGYFVSVISPEDITKENLEKFDAVVVGIRAYNVVNELQYKQNFLEEYAQNGGTVIVQYNTYRGLLTEHLAPYALHLSNDRVTDETAKITILDKDNPVLNFPNAINESDFNGWTQERGLYFPDKWGKEFTPVLSMHDKGESAKKGSLLVAKYGKGYYIYTGLSFFRELPAGVPGAFKLFSNLISIGKSNLQTDKIKG